MADKLTIEHTILPAIAGDIIGSPFEWQRIKREDFTLFSEESGFTDDTVLTIAVADVVLHGGSYVEAYRRWGRRYPSVGWGGMFRKWLFGDDISPYNSFGNGSAMRVSPVGFAYDTLDEVLAAAKSSAEVTHDHPEGIKGAQATAAAVFLARTGAEKEEIRQYVADTFRYDLSRSLARIRPGYEFDETCQGTVPEAIIAFLESSDYEDAVRKAVSLGGDSDTLACIAGGIAGAYYGTIPAEIARQARSRLDGSLLALLEDFDGRFGT